MSFICRLCLSTSSDHYKEIEEIERKQFEIVLPEIDLNIIDPPLICTDCTKTLQMAYTFKSSCLETERLLKSYVQIAETNNTNLTDIIENHGNIKVEDVKIEPNNDDDTTNNGDAEPSCSPENNLKIRCPICSKCYNRTHLNFHISRHLNMNDEMSNSVKKHLELYSNGDDANFLCQICKQSCLNIEYLIKHVKSHFVAKKFEDRHHDALTCEFCTKTFVSNDYLIAHIKTHFRRPRCMFCNSTFTELSSLKRHSLMVHDISIESKMLNAVVYETDEISMKTALNKYIEKSDLVKVRDVNLHTDRPFRCHLCPKTYVNKSHLKQHVLTHTKRPKCTFCNKIYTSMQTYKRHMLELHKVTVDGLENVIMVNNSMNVTCHQCNKEFVRRTSLIRHIELVHRGIKQIVRERHSKTIYTCEICGIMTRGKAYLKEHMRTHTGEKPYKCDECGKSFAQNSTLSTHKNTIHSNEYQFTCEYCSKRFKLMGSLTRHISAIHNPNKLEKRFECSQCGKFFF